MELVFISLYAAAWASFLGSWYFVLKKCAFSDKSFLLGLRCNTSVVLKNTLIIRSIMQFMLILCRVNESPGPMHITCELVQEG